jgi:hypothetical protein
MEKERGWIADPRPGPQIPRLPILSAVYARLAFTAAVSGDRLALASLFLLI